MSADAEPSLQVTECTWHAGHLRIACAGAWGVGSEGTPSARCVQEAIEGWMREHPDQAVREVTLDLREVEYAWGDGPVVALLAILRRGIPRAWIHPSRDNRAALEGLVTGCRIDRIALVPPAER